MKLSHYTKFVIFYSIAVFSTYIIGILLNEYRIDLYLSMYILEYYVLSAVYGVRLNIILNIVLFAIFMIIVFYRVSLILWPSVFP